MTSMDEVWWKKNLNLEMAGGWPMVSPTEDE
jgi:hypothetical protein